MIAPGLHFATLIGFAGLMVAAAVEDARRLVIPNAVVLALCALWLLRTATGSDASLPSVAAAVAVAASVFLAGAAVFAGGLIGGGDVKLISAACLWAGASRTAALLLLTGLLGGVLALVCLTPLGTRFGSWRREPNAATMAAGVTRGTPVPYGMAIATAALIVTLGPQFS
ncbi:MAG: prepilin peptidase [Stellaceae bacterium]